MRFSLLAALITFSSGFFVQATPVVASQFWSPKILSPNATTIWVAGEKETVIWSTANTPPDVSNAGLIQLFQGGPEPLQVLAGEFNLVAQEGSIQVTVPADLAAGMYEINLTPGYTGGDTTPPFHICTKTEDGKHLDCVDFP